MAVINAMYLFEVVVESVKSYVESRLLVIKSDFADVFSLELIDPKQMHIVIPDPPPLPPEPVGKKGKKAKKKPKPKKGKKGKKGKIELPPPEPVIQSGQSVLFTSSAEFLIQNMEKFPMEVSLWSKEDSLVYIGSATVPWDPIFITYLQRIAACQEPPAVFVRDTYNIFQEGTAKMMATLGLQVKLSYLTNQVTTSFRTLSEDPTVKKFLYTGMNSKTTSYMCTMKTTDEIFEENSNKIENNYTTDKPKPKPIVYADYKNAPGANVTFFNDGDNCCMGHVDKPPESIYKAPETCPDIDFISDYVRKIITSCNDNMRMLTPRPTIRPRIKATDIDRLCYCRETNWPEGELAERFKKEAKRDPCPICINAGGNALGRSKSATFNIANIRGPCGRPDCRIARDMRAYIENLVLEDSEEINIEEIFGPCGSKSCTLAEKIQQFLRHQGPFAHGTTKEGLQTQCACLKQMQDALVKREECDSECSDECDASTSSSVTACGGPGCPHNKQDPKQVYNVYYFTVEHDFDKEQGTDKTSSPSPSESESKSHTKPTSGTDNPPSQTESESKRQIKPTSGTDNPSSPSESESKSHTKTTSGTNKPPSQSESDSKSHIKSTSGTGKPPSQSESDSKSHIKSTSGTGKPPSQSESDSARQIKSTSGTGKPPSQSESDSARQIKSTSGTGKPPSQSESETKRKIKPSSGPETPLPNRTLKYKYCSPYCPSKIEDEPAECSKSNCFAGVVPKTDKKAEKCLLDCPGEMKPIISPADSEIVIKFDDIRNPCCVKSCNIADTVKDFIVESVNKKKQPKSVFVSDDPCYCDCECSFKFSKKTTYCSVCGGYECLGDDMASQPEYAKPHPCPVYHKLYDKKSIKVKSPWPEDSDKNVTETQSTKSGRTQSSRIGAAAAKAKEEPPSVSVKNLKEKKPKDKKPKKKKANTVGKFAANDDDQPLPQPTKKVDKSRGITVPRNMGWLWTAEEIPGMKPRPKWKPGAANKILVRRYRTIREGVDNIAKKKRALLQRKKKIEMKPTLVVKKQDGEYTVQMEVFKKYSKERLVFQYPYDEKPPLIYTIGKTPEEKLKIQKQRERRERRETRRKSRLLQSTFRDRCQEICLKAYNQAIGILPMPNINCPECPCDTDITKPVSPPIDSCSCSEEGTISSSDTDGDDWIIEFTPPLARWDTKAKHPPVLAENECQYNYMDYKVKLTDKQGNQVPRFFKGPDGKQECSDLGGFWGPNHVWTEISKDGYIGPDNRWVPLSFTGPDGMLYASEDGVFTDVNGNDWKIGIDGYIDKDSKWVPYGKKKDPKTTKSISTVTGTTGDTKKSGRPVKSESTSVVTPKGKPDVKGKDGKDGKAAVVTLTGKTHGTTEKPPALGNKVVSLPVGKGKTQTVMNLSMTHIRKKLTAMPDYLKNADQKKFAKYREIIQGLQMYDDLGGLKPPMKTNRASNTPRRRIPPYSMDRCYRNMAMVMPTIACSSSSVSPCRSGTQLVPMSCMANVC